MSKEETELVDQKIQEVLRKDAISITAIMENHLNLSSLFLVGKKDGGNGPVINLKDLKKSIPYGYFKMEGLLQLNELLMPGHLMRKIDIKDTYFAEKLSRGKNHYFRTGKVCTMENL